MSERRPRLFAVWFDTDPAEFPTTGDWARMAAVLDHTARRHCPAWDVDVRRVVADSTIRPVIAERGITVNARKMRWWCDEVARAADGDRLVVLDADMFVTQTLDPLWDLSFDVAYTGRDGTRLPLNGGFLAFRINARSKAFMAQLWAVHERMMADAALHRTWRAQFAGMNQAALGYVLAHQPEADVRRLACREWNCEDTSWRRFNSAITRVVHVKSRLRHAVFEIGKHPRAKRPLPIEPKLERLVRQWREAERDAGDIRVA